MFMNPSRTSVEGCERENPIYVLLPIPKRFILIGIVLFVHFVRIVWGRAVILAFRLCCLVLMPSLVFVFLSRLGSGLGRMWDSIVSIPDHCLSLSLSLSLSQFGTLFQVNACEPGFK